jgi:putative DNA primase/helicase
MLDDLENFATSPLVTVIETGPRYSTRDLLAAFPPADTQAAALGVEAEAEAPDPLIITRAAEHFSFWEPQLWLGDWEGETDVLTGRGPFPSQSEADYYLAREIARWGLREGILPGNLKQFSTQIFEQSALADRAKWRQGGYRDRTIKAACTGLTVPSGSTSTLFGHPLRKQPDWTLKGDMIASRFFRDLHLNSWVYVPAHDRWLRWCDDRSRWLWCDLGEQTEAAKEVVLELYRLACTQAAQSPEKGQRLIAEVSGLQREPRIRAVLTLAKSEPGMSISSDALDAHPELLGVRNGVVDLRTGALQPNEPSRYITKYIDIDYHCDAQCPVFQTFMEAVFPDDKATIDAVQRLTGLTLTGRTDEEVIVFCVGRGANGKSIFGNAVSSVMGAYAVTAPPSLLAARRSDDHGARSDLAMLNGARLVSINELPGGMMLDETVTKQLAGREPISARFLHREFFTFLPRFTPWVRTNHRPIIKGTDNGIWRRLIIVPFRRTFKREEQDNGLEAKIMREAEGVLAWMVAGAQRYLKSGLKPSRLMTAELKRYRSDSDLLGEFLSDKTEPAAAAAVKQSMLFTEYDLWCGVNGLKATSKRVFSEQLTERGYGTRKSGADRYYTGLKCR